jgi:hypothetical protein
MRNLAANPWSIGHFEQRDTSGEISSVATKARSTSDRRRVIDENGGGPGVRLRKSAHGRGVFN